MVKVNNICKFSEKSLMLKRVTSKEIGVIIILNNL